MGNMVERMLRAAKLDPSLYEEVEADRGAMGQAMGVVVLSSIAAGIGTPGAHGVGVVLWGAVSALVGWYVWAFLTDLIGTRLLPEPQTQADTGQLLRTIGFASSPGLIRVLGVLPGLAWITLAVAWVWMIAAMVVAVRQALDYRSTARAAAVCLIAWLLQVVFLMIVFLVFGRVP